MESSKGKLKFWIPIKKEKAYCLFRMSLRVLLYFPMLLDLQPQNVTKKHFKIVGNIVKHIKRHHNYLHSQKDFLCIYILICYSTDKLIIGIKMYGITSHVSQWKALYYKLYIKQFDGQSPF